MFFFFKTKDAARITATLACHCVAPTLCVFIAQLVVVARWSSRYLEGEFDELVLVLNASFCLPAGQEEVPGHHPQLHGGARHRARHQHRAPAQLRQEPRHPERPRPAVPPQGNQGQSPPCWLEAVRHAGKSYQCTSSTRASENASVPSWVVLQRKKW